MSIALSSVAAFVAAVTTARSVELSAYTLRPGAVTDALLTAAHSGAHVRVRLERDPLDTAAGTLQAANAQTIALLVAAGADAAVTAAGSPVLHMKAAVVDGAAWLDDRNWAGDGSETVVCDSDHDDVAAVASALAGEDGSDSDLATTKRQAQGLEVDIIRSAGPGPLAVESESFGNGAISAALLARARAGYPTQLLVAGREAQRPGPAGERERRLLARLAALGVTVRTGNARGTDFDEKLTVAAGAAWVGSANATYARGAAGDQRDWGLTSREPAFIDGLRVEFERNWSAAADLRPTSADL